MIYKHALNKLIWKRTRKAFRRLNGTRFANVNQNQIDSITRENNCRDEKVIKKYFNVFFKKHGYLIANKKKLLNTKRKC